MIFSTKNVIERLVEYKNKYNFLIWEDSKFGDCDLYRKKINNHIIKWADLISTTPIGGQLSIENKNIGVILIGEMSCQGQILDNEYQNKVIELSKKLDNVVGIVCQHKMSDTLLILLQVYQLQIKKILWVKYTVVQKKIICRHLRNW